MQKIDIESKLNEMLVKNFKIEPADLQENKSFDEDLGMDSLDMVNLLVAIKKELGIDIQTAQAVEIKTIGELTSYLASQMGSEKK
jgi:acyl carrier protein